MKVHNLISSFIDDSFISYKFYSSIPIPETDPVYIIFEGQVHPIESPALAIAKIYPKDPSSLVYISNVEIRVCKDKSVEKVFNYRPSLTAGEFVVTPPKGMKL